MKHHPLKRTRHLVHAIHPVEIMLSAITSLTIFIPAFIFLYAAISLGIFIILRIFSS